jgi:hypothetical protein
MRTRAAGLPGEAPAEPVATADGDGRTGLDDAEEVGTDRAAGRFARAVDR